MPYKFLIKFLLGVFLFLLNNNIVLGQEMNIKSKWEIRYGTEILDYREMSDKFDFNPEVLKNYKKSIKSFKSAKVTGMITLGALGAGVIFLNIDKGGRNCSSICVTTADYIGLGFLGLVPITGITSLVILKRGINKQKKAVDAYNQNVISFQKEKLQTELVLGATQNGVGLVLQF